MLNYELLRFALMGAVACAAGTAMYAVASAPSRVASRLGMRGLKRRRALESNQSWAQIEPLVRWLGVRVSGLLSESFTESADDQLMRAGDYLGLTPEEYVGLSIVSFFGGILFGCVGGLMVGNVLLIVTFSALVGAMCPYLLITGEGQRRLKQINRGLPYVIDLMALGMSAGLDFPGAIRHIVDKTSDPEDALVEELTRMLQEFQLGQTRRHALLDFARRAPLQAVSEFVSAVVQAEDRGNPVAEVLQIQAVSSRQRRTVLAEEAAAKAGVAMVAPLFLLFGCIMLLVVAPMVLKLATVE